MTKGEFLRELRSRLVSLPEEEITKTTLYYSEMIEDRVEDGMSVEEAIDAIGSIDEIASQVLSDRAESAPSEQKSGAAEPKPKKKAGRIVAAIVTFPIWFSVAAVLGAMVIAFIAVIWALVAASFVCVIAFFGASILAIFKGAVHFTMAEIPSGLFFVGGGVVFAGLGILFIMLTKYLARLGVTVTLLVFDAIKRIFARREANRA